MSRRIKATHKLSVHRPDTGSDSYTEDPEDNPDTLIVEEVPARFRPGGGLVRSQSGDMVVEAPNATIPGHAAKDIHEGDKVSLEAISTSFRGYDDLEVESVNEVYGRGPTPIKARIRLGGL